MGAEITDKKQKKKIKAIDILINFLLVASILFFVFTKTVKQPVRIVGESMMPTYEEGQFFWADRLDKEYHRFDVVVLKCDGRYIIKRIIGLPGEIVEIMEDGIKINGEYIDDVVDVKMKKSEGFNYMRLDDNNFFVLGDNRNNSADSRFYGPFTYDDIVGKVST